MAAPAFPIAVWLAEKAAEVVTAAAVAVYIAIVIDDETDLDDLEEIGDVADGETDLEDLEETGDVTDPAPKEETGGSQDQTQGAKPIPAATSNVGVRTEECEDCNDCKPRDGYIYQPLNRNYHIGSGDWLFYQLFIANMGGGPFFNMVDGKIQEWKYNGVDFDGFWSSSCTLVEAKKGYEKFLIRGNDGEWIPGRAPFMETVLDNFNNEAELQIFALNDSRPQAKLRWYFSADPTYQYFQIIFELKDMQIETYLFPYVESLMR
ncbi:restriction endonuclease fold toxin 5 domain-containing protein [Halomonas denitrificans]|uniref:Tox-REase-5 domain-containing protein n=1 Tax=Halomonas denitrificans TaxID=370769 RepID=UPI001CD3B0F7|nr:Tox-REase-5 domain-containing protein [Halomonas denitrificans]MCA0973659.1 restriction endonuclease fold toxin 5 domain-containing protein [Halomonas denitrificans]